MAEVIEAEFSDVSYKLDVKDNGFIGICWAGKNCGGSVHIPPQIFPYLHRLILNNPPPRPPVTNGGSAR